MKNSSDLRTCLIYRIWSHRYWSRCIIYGIPD